MTLRTAASLAGSATLRDGAGLAGTIEAQTIAVAASADDANQVIGGVNDGLVSLTGTTIGFQSDRTGGFRCDGILAPQGATIVDARVQFVAANTIASDNAAAPALDVTITGHDADDAGAFTTTTNDLTDRDATAASVTWTIPASTGAGAWTSGESAGLHRTPDLAAIVQEIVDREGWTAGNALALIFDHDGVGAGSRQVAAYDHATLAPPSITIRWIVP